MINLQNNKFVKDAKVSINSSISRGFGIFETIRTFGNKEIPLLKLHIKRLQNSAKQIGLKLKYKPGEIAKMTLKVAKKSPHKIQRIKIYATEQDLIITSQKAGRPKTQATLKSICINRSLPDIKSISYLPSILANRQAEQEGFTDALLIDEKGEVFECAYANIFWFEKDTLCTRKDQILPGITREIILKSTPFKTKFKNIKLEDLKNKECFMTQSVSLITPITKIDSKKLKTSEKTQKVIEAFNQTVDNLNILKSK